MFCKGSLDVVHWVLLGYKMEALLSSKIFIFQTKQFLFLKNVSKLFSFEIK